MWRRAGAGLAVLSGRGAGSEVCARVPGAATWIRATPAALPLCPGVHSSPTAGVMLRGCGGLAHTSAMPDRLLHTTSCSTTDSDASVAVVEAEVEDELDRLYSQVEVECRGHEPAVLRSYQKFVSTAAAHLDVPLEKIEWPKKHIQRWTLLKSIHIHKKHRVQYEARTHFLVMRFVRLTSSTADTFLEYIQRNLPEGVAMKVTKHEIQKLPEHVKPSVEVVA
ncbi:28S ribosomal protein S10, mitochondrial-like [Portunus trituberculatus]|uniref:28S ribosomal protein S10, mitochondrial-like n=1 Tax=Portunus trituberculatus TaxID=210409 RepID=UPI001E1CDB6F|nr:28S ribosomal protein S10, mitochondrial-like [Portunus trituberculatus]